MKRRLLRGQVITEEGIKQDYGLLFSEVIEDLKPFEDYGSEELQDVEVLEHRGFIAPGLIDMHIHGAMGADAMDGSQESLRKIRETLVRSGTTSFLPTTMTMSEEVILRALDAIREARDHQAGTLGAKILGVHLEGPFINESYKGAQDAQHIQKPNSRWLRPYYDLVKIITLAPEKDENFAMTREWRDAGILLSMGHSGATYAEAKAAYEHGVTHVTHCFNAMSKLHHREPGVVGAALLLPFTVDMITDGYHLRPEIVEAVTRWKSSDQICLITDAMRAGYLSDGPSELGGQPVMVQNGKCTLEDGTIAGSVLRMDQAIRNTLLFTEMNLVRTINMASINVARELSIADRKGSLAVGKDADIALFSPELEVRGVYVEGVDQAELLQ